MENSLPYFLVALVYFTIATLYWRHVVVNPRISQAFLACALMAHGVLNYQSVFVADGMNLGLTNALSTIFWLTTLIYWGALMRHDLHRLQAFVLPPAAILLLLQWGIPEHHVLTYASEPLFRLHLIIAFAAFSLFTFAALHAVLMAAAERTLHRKSGLVRLPDFPPLLGMEILLFQILTVGFVLLTLTLVSGALFSEQLFHKAFQINHKTIFTMISWLVFAWLLVGRWRFGWRGRKAVRWTLSGFGMLLLAYVGSKFVLEFLLGR